MSDFKVKMHQNRSAPHPLGSLHAPPDPLAVFKGPTFKGMRGKAKRGKKKGREKGGEGEGKGWEGRTTLHTPCRKFLATPLEGGSEGGLTPTFLYPPLPLHTITNRENFYRATLCVARS